MLKADMEMGKTLARIIAKEEIAAASTKSEIKDLETKVDKLVDMLANEIKDLDAKIKSLAAAKPIFDKKGGK